MQWGHHNMYIRGLWTGLFIVYRNWHIAHLNVYVSCWAGAGVILIVIKINDQHIAGTESAHNTYLLNHWISSYIWSFLQIWLCSLNDSSKQFSRCPISWFIHLFIQPVFIECLTISCHSARAGIIEANKTFCSQDQA